MTQVSIIIPCFQNEANIPVTCARLIENESQFEGDVIFQYIMIDDGSTDGTWRELSRFKQQAPKRVTAVRLAANVGSYDAIHFGLKLATGNCLVVMAADLQDPPEHIQTMFKLWQSGHQVVLANRLRPNEGWLPQLAADTFHFLIRVVALPNLPKEGFDFCLFDRSAQQFMLNNWIVGTNSLYILLKMDASFGLAPYQKSKREIGSSQWTFSKKLTLFFNTFFAFSKIPPYLLLFGCWTVLIVESVLCLTLPASFSSISPVMISILILQLVTVCFITVAFIIFLSTQNSTLAEAEEIL